MKLRLKPKTRLPPRIKQQLLQQLKPNVSYRMYFMIDELTTSRNEMI